MWLIQVMHDATINMLVTASFTPGQRVHTVQKWVVALTAACLQQVGESYDLFTSLTGAKSSR